MTALSALVQTPILAPSGRLGRAQVFSCARPEVDPRPAVQSLARVLDPARTVVGFGAPLCMRLDRPFSWLRTFPALSGPGCSVPSTQGALVCLLSGEDRGELLHQSRALCSALAPSFTLDEAVDTFIYRDSRDLTGYVDGTENPKDDAALAAAVMTGRGPGLDGGSLLAVQRWMHDLDGFERRSAAERDALIGRSRESNEELDDAPASAHVKRSAQESYDPPAFMLRRSMPYATARESGLYFVAYGESLDRFERVLRRMLGLEDGIVDGLFAFSRAVTGGYYFCPPLRAGRLDLSALGL